MYLDVGCLSLYITNIAQVIRLVKYLFYKKFARGVKKGVGAVPSASGEGRPAEQGASDTREEEKKTDDDQLHQKKNIHPKTPACTSTSQEGIKENRS